MQKPNSTDILKAQSGYVKSFITGVDVAFDSIVIESDFSVAVIALPLTDKSCQRRKP